jgi:hypothetical protein
LWKNKKEADTPEDIGLYKFYELSSNQSSGSKGFL